MANSVMLSRIVMASQRVVCIDIRVALCCDWLRSAYASKTYRRSAAWEYLVCVAVNADGECRANTPDYDNAQESFAQDRFMLVFESGEDTID